MLLAQTLRHPLAGIDLAILFLLPILIAHFFGIQRRHRMAPGPNQRRPDHDVRILRLSIFAASPQTTWTFDLRRVKVFTPVKSDRVILLAIYLRHELRRPTDASHPLEDLRRHSPQRFSRHSV